MTENKRTIMKKGVIFGLFFFAFFIIFPLAILSAQTASNQTYCQWDPTTKKCIQVFDCNPGCVPPKINCRALSRHGKKVCESTYKKDCICTPPPSNALQCKWVGVPGLYMACERVGDCGPGYKPIPEKDPCQQYQTQTECDDHINDAGSCIPEIEFVPILKRDPCYDYHKKTVNQKCAECLGGSKENEDTQRPNVGKKVWTAIGCIPVEPGEFIARLIKIAYGIGGGVAFLFMVFGSFKILTSQGNPEILNEGKSMLTSSISGLLLIIFSIIILKIIGYDILGLPGFEH